MTKNQRSKLRMYKVVHTMCTESSAIIAEVPNFAQFVTDLEITIDEIERLTRSHAIRNKGITKQNIQLRDQLIDMINKIGGLIFVYATNINNNHLRENSNFTRSLLLRLSQTDLVNAASQLIEDTKSLESEFEAIGIKQEDINEFEKLFTDYRLAYLKPREIVVTRAVTTKEIRNAFRFADSLVKEQSDKLILSFKKTNPQFYNRYQNARIIADLGVRRSGVPLPEEPEEENANAPSADAQAPKS